MSLVTKALDSIKLAAAETKGGVGELAVRAGVNIDTARRLVKAPPVAIDNLRKLEIEAAKVLGERDH